MTNLVFARNGQALTTSEIIAQGVGVQHKNILALVRNYQADFETFNPVAFETRQGKALPQGGFGQGVTIAILSEQQATLLVTYCKNTETVRKFKVALVKAFYEMRQQLHPCPAAEHIPPAYLTLEHQYAIQSEVAKRVHKDDVRYQTVYQALKARFRVPKYTCILDRDFDAAVHFIRTCNLRVPEVPEQKPEPQVKTYTVTATFLERVRAFVYYWRYLHRADLERFLCLMQSLNSPYAAQFAEAIKNLNLILLEGNLEQLGFPVKELQAYKTLMESK